MQNIYFTPGPSQLYPSYQKHLLTATDLQLGSINHRSETFRKIYRHTNEQLRQLMNIPSSHYIFFASSATEIWEKILLNCVEQNSFHVTNGAFSNKFYDFSKQLLKAPKQFQVEEGKGFMMQEIIVPEETELICTTQNETSTGVQIPEDDLLTIKERYPDKLLCTDLVSIAPYSSIDYTKMDCSFFSVQKAFGMPPGLGVWIVNEACVHKAENMKQKGINIGAHNTLESYLKNYKNFETPSTPNVIAIYILGMIAEDMNHYGISNIRKEIDAKAKLIYNFAEGSPSFSPLVSDEKHRSKTVVVLNTQVPSSEIISRLKEKKMIVGSGYGAKKQHQIRIANFPATSFEQMELLLKSLE